MGCTGLFTVPLSEGHTGRECSVTESNSLESKLLIPCLRCQHLQLREGHPKVYEWQGAGFYSLALIFTSRHLLKLSIVLSHDEKEEAQALFLHLKQELLYFGDLHETWGVLRASEDFTCG